MLQTFRAVLKGNSIEWLDEALQLREKSIAVHITVLEESAGLDPATRNQRMSEKMENLTFSDIAPGGWQSEVRHDRPNL